MLCDWYIFICRWYDWPADSHWYLWLETFFHLCKAAWSLNNNACHCDSEILPLPCCLYSLQHSCSSKSWGQSMSLNYIITLFWQLTTLATCLKKMLFSVEVFLAFELHWRERKHTGNVLDRSTEVILYPFLLVCRVITLQLCPWQIY